MKKLYSRLLNARRVGGDNKKRVCVCVCVQISKTVKQMLTAFLKNSKTVKVALWLKNTKKSTTTKKVKLSYLKFILDSENIYIFIYIQTQYYE